VRPRQGEALVAAQLVLLAATAVTAATVRGRLPAPARIAGVALLAAGAGLAVAGAARLGPDLTPLPEPRPGAPLLEDVIFGRVRHPIYGGFMLAAAGAALAGAPAAAVPAAALAVVLRRKAVIEERALRAAHPGYDAYAARVRRRFLP
jgi:protein-S-isoprenylcysteine O-methyltransferase Ste14